MFKNQTTSIASCVKTFSALYVAGHEVVGWTRDKSLIDKPPADFGGGPTTSLSVIIATRQGLVIQSLPCWTSPCLTASFGNLILSKLDLSMRIITKFVVCNNKTASPACLCTIRGS